MSDSNDSKRQRRSSRTSTPPNRFNPSPAPPQAKPSRKASRASASRANKSRSRKARRSPTIDYPTTLEGQQIYREISHLKNTTLPTLQTELESFISTYKINHSATDDEVENLEFPSSEIELEVTRTPKKIIERHIRRILELIRETNMIILIYEEDLKGKTSDPSSKYRETITTTLLSLSNEDKRLVVLQKLFGKKNPEIIAAITQHDAALKQDINTSNISEWCENVSQFQRAVFNKLDTSERNMYITFTTPLYCYVNFYLTLGSDEQTRYKKLFAKLFDYLDSHPEYIPLIMMSDCHHFMDISISIFRQLFNDGMILSKFQGHSGTIKTGCRNNTLGLLQYLSSLDVSTSKSIIKCLCCGDTLFDIEDDGTGRPTLQKKNDHTKHACDHTISVAPAFYYLDPKFFENNLLYLCRACNLAKSDIGIIEFLFRIFSSPEKFKKDEQNPDVDAATQTHRINAYEAFMNDLAKHFVNIHTIIDALTYLKMSYDSSTTITMSVLSKLTTTIESALNLARYELQSFEQAQKGSQDSILSLFINIIETRLDAAESREREQPLSATALALIDNKVFLDLIADIQSSVDRNNITLEDIDNFLIRQSRRRYTSNAGKLEFHRAEIARALMLKADTDKDGSISIVEFKNFFDSVADNFREKNYAIALPFQGYTVAIQPPTSGGFNKYTIKKKIKSKNTNKFNHRKFKSQKNYRKHTNKLRKHKSLFTKTFRKYKKENIKKKI
jgi:hypothetical protein